MALGELLSRVALERERTVPGVDPASPIESRALLAFVAFGVAAGAKRP